MKITTVSHGKLQTFIDQFRQLLTKLENDLLTARNGRPAWPGFRQLLRLRWIFQQAALSSQSCARKEAEDFVHSSSVNALS